jgi:hypothetical protein
VPAVRRNVASFWEAISRRVTVEMGQLEGKTRARQCLESPPPKPARASALRQVVAWQASTVSRGTRGHSAPPLPEEDAGRRQVSRPGSRTSAPGHDDGQQRVAALAPMTAAQYRRRRYAPKPAGQPVLAVDQVTTALASKKTSSITAPRRAGGPSRSCRKGEAGGHAATPAAASYGPTGPDAGSGPGINSTRPMAVARNHRRRITRTGGPFAQQRQRGQQPRSITPRPAKQRRWAPYGS